MESMSTALKMDSFTRVIAWLENRGSSNAPFYFVYISSFIVLFYFSTPVFGQQKRYEFQKGLMGSPFRLVFYAADDSLAACAARQAFGRIEYLNEVLSDYRDGSEINRLSAQSGSGKWILVSDELFEILAISQKLSKQTYGTFDSSVGPAVQLWRRAMRRNTFPTDKEINEVRKRIGYQYIQLHSRTKSIRLGRPKMRLDVGGIGKGYAADEAVEVLRGLGISSILIDAGGDLTLADPPPGSQGWRVEVTSGTEQDSVATLVLANVGVATSGATYRYLEHDGQRYSHIVNPKTGIGLQFHVRTTVVAANGAQADALATALSVVGIQKAKKISRKFRGIQVWLLETKDGKMTSWNTLH
jgi:thiamine biosynthesis lipoprotein